MCLKKTLFNQILHYWLTAAKAIGICKLLCSTSCRIFHPLSHPLLVLHVAKCMNFVKGSVQIGWNFRILYLRIMQSHLRTKEEELSISFCISSSVLMLEIAQPFRQLFPRAFTFLSFTCWHYWYLQHFLYQWLLCSNIMECPLICSYA